MANRLGIDIGIGTTDTIASVAVDGAPVQLVSLGARSQQTHLAVSRPTLPAPGQDPPGQDPPGPGEPGSPGYPPGAPPTQAYGAGGLGGPGGYPPGPGGEGSGGFRGKLASIIAGTLVLVGVAVGVGFLISGRGEPRSTAASPEHLPVGQSGGTIAGRKRQPVIDSKRKR